MANELNQKVRFIEKDIVFVLRLIAGYLLVIIGLIGLIFPIMPDWILILIGIGLFDTEGVLRKKIIKMIPQKYRLKAEKIILYDILRKEGLGKPVR